MMSTSATNQPNRQSPVRNHLPTGISHTKMSPERTPQDAKAHWGNSCSTSGAANAIWRGTDSAPRVFLLRLLYRRFTIGRKERMPHRKVDPTVGNRRGKEP